MQSLAGMEWLKTRIKKLEVTSSTFKDEIQQIVKIKAVVYNEFREWTPLKLILLNYALDVCTMIIKHASFFKNRYYIDLFAGSGLNKLKGTKDFLIGSPLIASLNYSDDYTSMIFCEKDIQYSEALRLRLSILKKQNLIIEQKACESCLDNILEKVNKNNTYSFFFIDPHSTEFSWDSMKKILRTRSDILFTFMSSEIFRAVGLANADIGTGKVLTKMFGDDSWRKANSAEKLADIYKQNVLKERNAAPIRVIKIQSKQFYFCYHLFFITNITKGGNEWLKALDKAKKEIEANSDIAVKKALDIVKKRQSELSQF